MLDKIKEIVVDQMDVNNSQVTGETNLLDDLGADSLDAIELMMALEEEFDIDEIPDSKAESVRTVNDIVNLINELK